MKANVITPDNNSFLVAARQLKDRGVISIEQYATMLRRNGLRQ